jgi:hypothetical protein
MGGKGARHLEALAVANAEAAGGLLREVEQVCGGQDALQICGIHSGRLCGATEDATDADVILHAQPWKHPDQLKRPADPQTTDPIAAAARDVRATEEYTPRRRSRQPGQDIKQAGFTRPIRTDERDDITAVHGATHLGERHQPAKPEGEPIHLE